MGKPVRGQHLIHEGLDDVEVPQQGVIDERLDHQSPVARDRRLDGECFVRLHREHKTAKSDRH